MKKDEITNRLSEFMDEGRGFMRKVADDVGTGARDMAFKAKKELVRGRRAIVSAEESVTRQAKDHPVAFVLLGVAIASAFGAALILGTRLRDKG